MESYARDNGVPLLRFVKAVDRDYETLRNHMQTLFHDLRIDTGTAPA